eukprot:Awhi_evm1s153
MSKSLAGLSICISGKLSMGRSDWQKKIILNGGAVENGVTKKCTHLITTEDEIDSGTAKVAKAQASGIPILSEDFLLDSISKKKLQPEKKYVLGEEASKKSPKTSPKKSPAKKAPAKTTPVKRPKATETAAKSPKKSK